MISFPNCKINLGLNITGKRADGYHNLETIFLPLNFKDALEIIHSVNSAESLHYSASGIIIDTDPANNLCSKAYHLLKKDYPAIPHIQLHLHKAIPTGAGLGGGSADARRDRKLGRLGYRVLRVDAGLVTRDLKTAVTLVRTAIP